MKRTAQPVGKVTAVEIVLLTGTFAGLLFLGWIGLTGGRSAPHAPVPQLRFSTRDDGMPVAAFDSDALSALLSAYGIPALHRELPTIETAVAQRLHQALQSLSENPSAGGYGLLGQIFSALSMPEQGHACFAEAVRQDPGESRWRHYCGWHLASFGAAAEAEQQFRRAMDLNPSYLPTHWRLARLLAREDRIEEAKTILRQTLATMPPNPYPWTELASLELHTGRGDEAEALLVEALKRDGLDGRAHALLSQVHAVREDRTRAEEHARKGRYSVKGLDPIPDPLLVEIFRATDSASHHRIIAESLSQAGDADAALALLERVVRAHPANPDNKVELARVYFEAGRPHEAVATLEAAIRQAPRGARFRAARAQLAVRMGDAAAALRYADEALAIDATSVVALGIRSLVLSARGRADEAVAPAERTLELSPDEPEVYAFLAAVYAQAGRRDDAVATYRRGLAVAPDSASLRDGLAQLTTGDR